MGDSAATMRLIVISTSEQLNMNVGYEMFNKSVVKAGEGKQQRIKERKENSANTIH
jgi:hypothetical protein